MSEGSRVLTLRGLFALGCRLIAVGFLLHMLMDLPYLLEMTVEPGEAAGRADRYLAFSLFVTSIAFPVALLLTADHLSRLLVSDTTIEGIELGETTVRAFIQATVLLVGLFGILESAPPLMNWVSVWWDGASVSNLVRPLTRLILGVSFVLGAAPFSRLLVNVEFDDGSSRVSVRNSPWVALLIVLLIFVFVLMVNVL